jgi:hypothetical protein
VWPSSPRMADGGGNGGIQWGPEPLGHRWWTGGVEGGAVEERVWHSGVDKGDGVKKWNGGGRRLLWWPSGAGKEEKGQGVSRGLAPRGWKNGEEKGGGCGAG